ncbi:MAG: class D sortase [Xanthomonadales bacterium]|nr:class D sortase [Xanthomonadales bacterium]
MKFRLIDRTGWRQRVLASLLGITAITLASPAFADTGEQTPAGTPPAQAVKPSWVWIQDPWIGDSVLTMVRAPDQSLWDATQIKDYEAALKADYPPPLGILTIDDLNIQVPIFNGTDDRILDRGAGRIKGMAKMNEDGNLGISAHRDSFFRALKDIEMGDEILVQSTHGVEKYAVSNINIVPKADASVLAPVDQKTLTLVTCYPFYHVGHAPERYIVTALPVPEVFE